MRKSYKSIPVITALTVALSSIMIVDNNSSLAQEKESIVTSTEQNNDKNNEVLIDEGAVNDKIKIDGFHFQVTSENTVSIINGSETKVSNNGVITIPESVNIDNKKYIVDSIGEQAFINFGGDSRITKVILGNNIKTIGHAAFRDNKIESIDFKKSQLETIKTQAFMNNKLTGDISLPSTLKELGGESFKFNNIDKVSIPNSLNTAGDEIFSNNKKWVQVITDSSAIKTTEYKSGFGQIKNPVIVTVKSVDEKNNEILSPKVLGEDFSDKSQLFEKGVQSRYSPQEIRGYKLLTKSPISFTPNNLTHEITVKYEKVSENPVILGNVQKFFKSKEVINKDKLLQGITAKDFSGKDITSSLKVSPETINSNIPGEHKVFYTATDGYGNTIITEGKVTVGLNWPDYEFGGGWQVKDFTFDGSVVTGFSSSGIQKIHNGQTALYLPPLNTEGEPVSVVGSFSFQNSNITSIESWGQIQKIEDYAFYYNKIEKLPTSWGQITYLGAYSFNYNVNLKDVPSSWGNIEEIGDAAFESNYSLKNLGNDWGNVKKIGNNAFKYINYNVLDKGNPKRLTTIPSSWGKIESIGEEAFYSANISGIPSNWNKVKFLGEGAFKDNKIKNIPSDWGNISEINYAIFEKNEIETIPESWKSFTKIGNKAFAENKITKIPKDWQNIEIIGDRAFYDNEIVSLPKTWENISKINTAAFSGNNLTSIPSNWNNIEKIGEQAFSRNKIKEIPTSLGKIKDIGDKAFYGNDLKKKDYTINFKDLTRSLFDSLENSGIKLPITVYTDNRKNPSNIPGSNENQTVRVNPAFVQVTYKDNHGNELMPTAQVIIAEQDLTKKIIAPEIFGYKVIKNDIPVKANNNTYTANVVYREMTEAEIKNIKRADVKIEEPKNNPYKIGSKMSTYFHINTSGFTNVPINNAVLRLKLDTSVYDVNSIEIGDITGYKLKTAYEKGKDYIDLHFDNPIQPSATFSVPFKIQFKEKVTPKNTLYPIKAELFSEGETVGVSKSNAGFIGEYSDTRIYSQSNSIIDVENTKKNSDGVVYLNDNSDNAVKKHIYITGDRNIDKYTVTIPLPTYYPAKGSAHYNNGEPVHAIFNASENPGWSLNTRTNTLTYKSPSDFKVSNSDSLKPLILHYPGLPIETDIKTEMKLVAYPNNKPSSEPILTNESTKNYKFRVVDVQNQTGLHISKSHDGYYRIYDHPIDRNKEIFWKLSYSAFKKEYKDVVFEDFGLDSRLKYKTVEPDKNLGDVLIEGFDSKGVRTFSKNIINNDNRVYTIPTNKQNSTSKIRVKVYNPIKNKQSGKIKIGTVFRNPNAEILKDEAYVSLKNHLKVYYDNNKTIEDKAEIKVYPAKNEIDAWKTIVNGDSSPIITGRKINFDLGFSISSATKDDILNFEQIDIIPEGLTVTNYTKSDYFNNVPGSSVEIVDNYQNTGKQAVIWKAPKIDNNENDKRRKTGSITLYMGATYGDDVIINQTFVKSSNMVPEYKEINNKTEGYEFLPNGKWARAESRKESLATKGLFQEKYIRSYSGTKPNVWSLGKVITTPGSRFDYKIIISNTQPNSVNNLVIYDVLPYIGDYELDNTDQTRGTAVENTIDVNRAKNISLPDGLKIQYYNSNSNVPKYNKENAKRVLNNLNWSDTPAANTKAIRIIGNGKPYRLDGGKFVEVVIPMIANKETSGIPGVASERNFSKSAYNSSYFTRDGLNTLIEGNVVSNTIGHRTVDIRFEKVDEANKPLPGADFTYYNSEGRVISRATSDENGIVHFKNILVKENDYIVETRAPESYDKSEEKIVITKENRLSAYNSTDSIMRLPKVKNSKTIVKPTGKVRFEKVNSVGEPIYGVRFSLSRKVLPGEEGANSEGMIEYTTSSRGDGVVEFDKVTPGTNYTLKEIEPKNKYAPIKDIHNLSVIKDNTTYISVDKNGVVKTNNTTNSSIRDKSINKDNAQVVNSKLQIPLYKISVTENSLMKRGEYNPQTGKEEYVYKTIGDYNYTDGAMINGSTFVLYKDIENKPSIKIGEFKPTDEKPAMLQGKDFTPTDEGESYRLVETVMPNRYAPVKEMGELIFTVDNYGNMFGKGKDIYKLPFPVKSGIYIPNLYKGEAGQVTINKIESNNPNKPLKDARFAIFMKNEKGEYVKIGKDKTTNSSGVVSWVNLEAGEYKVVETQAPNGYSRSPQEFDFTVKYGAQSKDNTFIFTSHNNKIQARINKIEYLAKGLNSQEAAIAARDKFGYNKNNSIIIKRGNTYGVAIPIEGAKFDIRAGESTNSALIQGDIVSDKKGIANITVPLNEDATYYVHETVAPEGYLKSDTVKIFKPSDFTRIRGFDGVINVYFENNPANGRIVISKTNTDTQLLLKGVVAKFDIEKLRPATNDKEKSSESAINYNGNIYVPDTTFKKKAISTDTKSSFALADNLDYGLYSIRETKAPAGYNIEEDIKVVEITEENPTYTYVFGNTPSRPKLELSKKVNGKSTTTVNRLLINENVKELTIDFTVKNTGNTKIENLKITDVISEGNKDANAINNKISNANIKVKRDNKYIKKYPAIQKNGSVVLYPGESATIRVTTTAPITNASHVNKATVTATAPNVASQITDTDSAYVYKAPTAFPLPKSGATGIELSTLIILLLLQALGVILVINEISRRKK